MEKEQALLKIDHEQVLEQKKQAEANRDARRAQLEQAKLRIGMTEKQQASQITQDRNAVEVAKAALESLDANTRQRITEAETKFRQHKTSFSRTKSRYVSLKSDKSKHLLHLSGHGRQKNQQGLPSRQLNRS